MATIGGPGGTTTPPPVQDPPGSGGTQGPGATNINPNDFTPNDFLEAAEMLGLYKPNAFPSNANLMIVLAALKSKVDNEQLQSSAEDIQTQKQVKASAAAERMKQLEEMYEKQSEGEKAGGLGKIFGWIAAAAMAIAGAILLATGVGTAAGVALLAGGIAMMAVMALQEGGAMDKIIGGMASLFEKMGMDPEAARIAATVCVAVVMIAASAPLLAAPGGVAAFIAVASTLLSSLFTPENLEKMGVPEDQVQAVALGISIGFAVVAIAGSIGPQIASKIAQVAARFGSTAATTAATATTTAAQTTATATKTAADATQQATRLVQLASKLTGASIENIQKMGLIMSYVSQGIMAGSTIGAGAAKITAADAHKDASDAEARTKEFEKELMLLQQQMQDEEERIQKLLQEIQESFQILSGILDSLVSTDKAVSKVSA